MDLVTAIQNRDAKMLLKVLQDEEQKSEADSSYITQLKWPAVGGISLLHWAAELGSKDCLKLLLTSKYNRDLYSSTDINKKDDVGATPLHYASGEGKLDCVNLLIENKANINAVDFGGETPLHWACLNGHQGCVEILLDRGAFINAVADNGFTPLHSATVNNHAECVSLLLNRAANTTIKNKQGKTPKDIAMEKNMTALIDYFNTGKRDTLDRLSFLEKEVVRLNEELNKVKEEKENTARRLAQKFKEEIAIQQQQKEISEKFESLNSELEKEKEKRMKAEEEVSQIMSEYKEIMQQNMKLEVTLSTLQQQQLENDTATDIETSSQKVSDEVESTPVVAKPLLTDQERDNLLYTLSKLQSLFKDTMKTLDEANVVVESASKTIL